MLKQTEGSRAMAEAIALSRPEVICAYPITVTPRLSLKKRIVGFIGRLRWVNSTPEARDQNINPR